MAATQRKRKREIQEEKSENNVVWEKQKLANDLKRRKVEQLRVEHSKKVGFTLFHPQ